MKARTVNRAVTNAHAARIRQSGIVIWSRRPGVKKLALSMGVAERERSAKIGAAELSADVFAPSYSAQDHPPLSQPASVIPLSRVPDFIKRYAPKERPVACLRGTLDWILRSRQLLHRRFSFATSPSRDRSEEIDHKRSASSFLLRPVLWARCFIYRSNRRSRELRCAKNTQFDVYGNKSRDFCSLNCHMEKARIKLFIQILNYFITNYITIYITCTQ